MAEDGEYERVRESFELLADDGVRTLRFNLLLIGLYVSAVGFLINDAGEVIQTRLITSYWTLGGLFIWFLGTMLALAVYEPSRTISVAPIFEETESHIYENFWFRGILWNFRASILASLGGGMALAVGILDAYIPIGVEAPVVVGFVLVLLLIGCIPMFLARLTHFLREQMGAAHQWWDGRRNRQ